MEKLQDQKQEKDKINFESNLRAQAGHIESLNSLIDFQNKRIIDMEGKISEMQNAFQL